MEVNAVSSDGEWTPLLLAVNLFSGEVAIPICETLLDGKADVNSTVSAGIYRRLMPVTIARRGGQDAARHGYFGPVSRDGEFLYFLSLSREEKKSWRMIMTDKLGHLRLLQERDYLSTDQ